MATIHGLTAERLLQLEADTIVGGHISGDDLILEKHDGSTVNAGSVRGIPGISDMSVYDPVGVPKPFMGSVAPTGNGMCDASTEYDGATYPLLAAMFDTGADCVNGICAAGKFKLPDLRGKMLVGLHGAISAFDTLHETGGSKDAPIVQHTHPSTQAGHDHGAATGFGGAHDHSIDGGDFGNRIVITYGSNVTGSFLDSGAGYNIAYSNIDVGGDHNHSIPSATPTVTTPNPTGSVAVTDKNMPPYRVVNFIMRLA